MVKEKLKELSNLKLLEKELDDTTVKLTSLRAASKEYVTDTVRGSSKYFPYTEKTFFVEGTDINIVKKIERYEKLLKKRELKILNQKIKIEEFIDTIESTRIRLIIGYKYLDKKSWHNIAYKFNDGSTADSLKQEFKRYFEKI